MLDWLFGNRVRITKKHTGFVQAVEAIITLQFTIAQAKPQNFIGNKWVLGYIYGVNTATLQNFGIQPSPEAFEYLKDSYTALYAHRKTGESVLTISMDMRDNRDFLEGQNIGGNEIVKWTKESPPRALTLKLMDLK